jgi:acyl carrier protein
VAFILNTLGQIWMAGVQIDWSGFYKYESRRRLPLPTYPFERQRYSTESGYDFALGVAPIPSGEYNAVVITDTKQKEQDNIVVSDRSLDDVENTLANIWHETLGVKRVNPTDNFFDLGGNSLIAVRMFAEIDKIFNKRLPLATLIGAPTIDKLAAILRDNKDMDSMSSLVPVQSGDSKPPIFFIHAAGGNLLIYRDLVRHLGSDQTVYGLQAQGLDGELPFHTSIEEMATHYVREIQSFQPDGPYLLAGYCLGGTVALEMAQQLHAQNKHVSLLALLETYNFSNVDSSLPSKIHHRMQQIEFHARNLFLSENKMTFFQEKAKVAWSRKNVWLGSLTSKLGIGSRIGDGRNSVLSNFWEASEQAAIDYVPREYPGRITEFLPKVNYACFDGSELGWEKLAIGGLETHVLPVYPRGMLVEPFVKLLAEQLKDCINKSLDSISQQENRSNIMPVSIDQKA